MATCCSDQKEIRVVFLGITGSGKTSLIQAICGEIMDDKKDQLPTQGFDINNILFEDQTLNIWDIGGSDEQQIY